VLIAVIVLVALLFLLGTVMALSVTSALRTVDLVAQEDASHYAAESATSRGVAQAMVNKAIVNSGVCSGAGTLKSGQPYTFALFPVMPDLSCPPAMTQNISAVQQWAIPAQVLTSGQTLKFDLDYPASGSAVTFWTVFGWQALTPGAELSACIDNNSGKGNCNGGSAAYGTPAPSYFLAGPTLGNNVNLHLFGVAGTVRVSPFVVRGTTAGVDSVVTVVGQSGPDAVEADVIIPTNGDGDDWRASLWNTVLP